MPIIRKRFRDTQPTHDDEGHVIDDSSLARRASCIGIPGIFPIGFGGNDQFLSQFQILSEQIDLIPIRTASRRIAAFEQNETG